MVQKLHIIDASANRPTEPGKHGKDGLNCKQIETKLLLTVLDSRLH